MPSVLAFPLARARPRPGRERVAKGPEVLRHDNPATQTTWRHDKLVAMNPAASPASATTRSRSARLRALALVLAIAFPVASCGLIPESKDDSYIEGSVEQLYNTGLDLMKKEEYKEAAKYFNQIDRQHPYSPWAARSQLMVAYANYKYRDYDTAILTLKRFERLHPGHRDIAYAYYLEGLCNFEQVRDTKRDQDYTRKAIRAFTIVSGRFPASKYVADANRKVAVLRDHLAGHEMEIGRFYQRKNLNLAALNRFKYVVDNFQGSRHVPEALLRMTESYTALGLRKEARRAAAVLGANFPSSRWYAYAYDLVQGKRSSPVDVPKKAETKKAEARTRTTAPPPPQSAPVKTEPLKSAADKTAATDKKAPDAAPPAKVDTAKTSPAKTSPAQTTPDKTAADKPAHRSFFGRLIDRVF